MRCLRVMMLVLGGVARREEAAMLQMLQNDVKNLNRIRRTNQWPIGWGKTRPPRWSQEDKKLVEASVSTWLSSELVDNAGEELLIIGTIPSNVQGVFLQTRPDQFEMEKDPQTEAKPLLVAYLSGVSNEARRTHLRANCFPDIRAKGSEPIFFIGRPSFVTEGSHISQGAQATTSEIEWAEKLTDELEIYNDIYFLGFRDTYRDLTDKTSGIMDFALKHRHQSILKIDDDRCPNMEVVTGLVETLQPADALYAGVYQFEGTEYTSMTGPDGSIAPYFSGPCYLVSSALAKAIFETDRAHTMLFAPYGTDSEDANFGKWFGYEKQHHTDNLNYKRLSVNDLCAVMPGEK